MTPPPVPAASPVPAINPVPVTEAVPVTDPAQATADPVRHPARQPRILPYGRRPWTRPGRAAPLRGQSADTALALAAFAAAAYERAVSADRLDTALPVALLLAALVAAPLALRRRAPLTGYLIGSAALSAEALFVLPSPLSPYANLVGLYSTGLYATRRRAQFALVVVPLGMAAYFAEPPDTGGPADLPAGVLFLWLLAWVVGYTAARRQEERDAARLTLRRQVVAEERARLARELHDLVGHTLSLMLVQAGAARRLLDRDPGRTHDVLTGLEHTGREALDELDRILGLLRRADPGGPEPVPAPAAGAAGAGPAEAAASSLHPGLADLPRLAERVRGTGLRVTVRIDPGAAERLPRTVDVSAYRIVQEALTNTVRHSRADHAEVTVRRSAAGPAERLDVLVRDDGRGPAAGSVPGRGLLGIAERVSLLGGRVEHGGGEGGGFLVHAELPIP
ncbi:sensor histidine kinase [Kitasatospora sp. NPDC054939]